MPEHLVKLFQDSAGHLADDDQLRLAEFLKRNADVFAKSSDDLGRTSLVKHRIDTGANRPVKQPPRRVPVHKKHIVQEELDKMITRGVIEPCDGPWSSPIVLVTKKDGTTRFCIDFRVVNQLTRKDAYPLPRIEDNIDALQGSTLYSTLDLISGFWQVEVDPRDRDKTAFSVGGGGLYRFVTMPFGLCNAPATFERLMERVLKGLQWEIAVLYIDDVVVFSKTVDEHLERLDRVLERFREAGLRLKASKCQLLSERVEFLGYIISANGVEVEPGKIAKVKQWPTPKCLRDVRSFVGLCAYYRRFVPDFSTICKPLFMLTKKGQPFVWGPAQAEAMSTMKKLLTEAPILSYPKPEGRYVLDTDASNVGIGAVLSQEQEGEEKVIAYGSKVLNKAQMNYCTTRRELLAIISFLGDYHHYLWGREFLVRTDHAALYWLLRKRDVEGQMARWLAKIQVYQMKIEHRPGKKHGNADALSRCMEGCRDMDALEIPAGETLTLQEMKDRVESGIVVRALTRAQARQPPCNDEGPTIEPQSLDFSTSSKLVEESPSPVRTYPAGPSPVEEKSSQIPVKASRPRKPARKKRTRSGLGKPSVETSVDHTELSSKDDEPGVPGIDREKDPPMAHESPPYCEKGEDPHSTRTGYPPKPSPSTGKSIEEVAALQQQEQFLKSIPPADWDPSAIARMQDLDPSVSKVRDWVRKREAPSYNESAKENAVVKAWLARFDQLVLSENGVLYIRWEADKPKLPPNYRVVATANMFGPILQELHDSKTAGHLGQKKTIERVKRSPFYWPGMVAFARRWVSNCLTCAARKHPKHSKRTPLQNFRVGATMDRVSIDLLGPFPRTSRGNTVILTVTDQYTRWVEAYALREATSVAVARCVVQFVCRLGMPLELHSDMGSNVHSKVLQEVCAILGIRKTKTTPYRPCANAISERENAVIKSMLAAFVNQRQTNWDDCLDPVMLAYRSSVHRTLGEAPATMMLGRPLRLPLDAFVGQPPEAAYQQMTATEYADHLAESMAQAHEVVSSQLDRHYDYQKKMYDRQVKREAYFEGQAVWLRQLPRKKGLSKSLMANYTGPWIIIKKLSDVNFRLQKSKNGKQVIIHSDRMKPFHGTPTDSWALKLWKPMKGAEGDERNTQAE